ncbi:MAG: hypothetical protein JWM68_5763 [Verrucomicrobiales bacterium]|nr:hypothetical protein [Verrucomicrobiales bacterium]
MKPSFMQHFFAQNWPVKIWLSVVALGSIFLAGEACEPSLSSLRDWHFLILFGSVILLAPIFTCYTSLLFVWVILGPLYQARGRMNGAPFQPGDKVRILVRPNRGRVVPVEVVGKSAVRYAWNWVGLEIRAFNSPSPIPKFVVTCYLTKDPSIRQI